MEHLDDIMGYQVLGTLGYGAKSTIFAVKDKDNHLYALKRVTKESPKDQRFIDQAIYEHDIASKLSHPSLRHSFKLIRGRRMMRVNEVIVLMELVDGVTMEQHHFGSLEELCRLMQLVAQGLAAMHDAGYVHADIKPKNILVTDKNAVKIIDFGQSCPVGTIKQRIQGTPDYIAPEQVLREAITPQTDMFNFGATMYWLLTRKHVPTLIPKDDSAEILPSKAAAKKPQPPSELNPQVPTALSSLVMHCIEKEPAARPSSMLSIYERLELAIAQMQRTKTVAANNEVTTAPPATT
ncbi:MAG: serine/threonine protein kinase [Phycisphaeraceae bacterium]|nr:serine/threonine protein kinase [Phycisphaeraceae bacterium]